VRVTIPASTSFRPGPAFLYLPPAQRAHPDRPLPVLELLHGTPGQPSDWFDRGSLVATADAFAAKHAGMAPIIVVPDINGARRADSECIRTTYGGDVETYLTRDVVAWVRHRYARTVGKRRWWVAGLSEGGLCSIMLALRHSIYSAFGDFSGLLSPQVEHVTLAESNRILFGNSTTARLQHDPGWLLAHHDYRGRYGWFATGASDSRTLAAQTVLVRAARAAHVIVHAETQPGRHAWPVWTYELRALLPWLWARARG
jgi:S-formylglutathione hydrolase FrmB